MTAVILYSHRKSCCSRKYVLSSFGELYSGKSCCMTKTDLLFWSMNTDNVVKCVTFVVVNDDELRMMKKQTQDFSRLAFLQTFRLKYTFTLLS